ncbi:MULTISPECIES: AAA family ATPase [unclassified Nocardioides]|uniref:ATP-dependent nuclease n=1 Tax=unclassified Nocardioides TaxID=2615069 RepID=UPI00005700FE|nr:MULTISPECIES: AAA family ATPase [unclassified Nocardioides]ABL79346.1 SMC domain protein [Nocardioides sp. JS614]
MLKKIAIRNYRTFKSFELEFAPDLNIVVGDNDAGKSTLLEAIGIALTLRLGGRSLQSELSPFLFNLETTEEYIAALTAGATPDPPEILIELFLDSASAPAILRGSNNLDGTDDPGVRVRIALNPDYHGEYTEFVKDPSQVRLVPTEYYNVQWLGFSGNAITFRSIPAVASLIDATTIRLASGADYHLQGIINNHLTDGERVELTRAYRSLREEFSSNPSIEAINKSLEGQPGDVSDRTLSLSIDVSQRSSWESNLVPHLDDLPFGFVGKGEQSSLKVLLALNRKVQDAHIVLVEEPENHLSFTNLNQLVAKISEKCKDKQVFITTHSSYVLNKLGLDSLFLLTPRTGLRLTDLPASTLDYFKKLSGYDTLRLVLAKKVILVEGPSDELVVQRAYQDKHGNLPIHDGVDVINVRGLSFKRFLDIAKPLGIEVHVVTDNDGADPAVVEAGYSDYTAVPHIHVHVGQDPTRKTLEPQLVGANGRDTINAILGTRYTTDVDLLKHMTASANKTTCALKIFEHLDTITMPGYIADAVA